MAAQQSSTPNAPQIAAQLSATDLSGDGPKPELNAQSGADSKVVSTTETFSREPKKTDKGTNISITTATDQHIQIWVPEDGHKAVTVRKTDGVRVVESDDENMGDKESLMSGKITQKITDQLLRNTMQEDTNILDMIRGGNGMNVDADTQAKIVR